MSSDGDGYFEAATTFVDGLRFPTDVKVWRNGVLICDAPDILFAVDADNDGRAETVSTLFTGFEVRNAQARVNSLRFGLDNWIYGAGGLFGGKITSHLTGITVDCSNRDFRVNPDTGVIEPVSGRTQQGRCRNDWGDWFGCSNGTLLRHISSDDVYEKRNPLVPPSLLPVLRVDPEAVKLFSPEDLVTFELSGSPGRATSACGLEIYRDVLLGSDYQNDAFTCEPVHQSVHRIDFRSAECGYVRVRGEAEGSQEFLSSTDRWFRAVQVRTGPDGDLWVVDMYRYVIEHSRWIPQSVLSGLDVYAGQGRGRIYRVVADPEQDELLPNATGHLPLIPDLQSLENSQLAEQLNSANGPTRDLVQQLLLWRNAEDIAGNVREIAMTSENPAARVQALATLNGLKCLKEQDLLLALNAPNAEVLRFAVQLSEPLLRDSPQLTSVVAAHALSSDLRLRRQAALSLGAARNDVATNAIARILSASDDNSHVRSAALNSVTAENILQVLQLVSTSPNFDPDEHVWKQLVKFSPQIGSEDVVHKTIAEWLPPVTDLRTGRGADQWVMALDVLGTRLAQGTLTDRKQITDQLEPLFQQTLATLNSDHATEEESLAAIRILGKPSGDTWRSLLSDSELKSDFAAIARASLLSQFISPRFSIRIQNAAIEAIISTDDAKTWGLLLASFHSLNGARRLQAVDGLLERRGGITAVLKAMKSGTIRIGDLDATRRDKLLSHHDAAIRATAVQLFGEQAKSNRADVVKTMMDALHLEGVVSNGRNMFRKRCSTCHRLEDFGHEVGPDLLALTNRDPEWLLTAILDPNKDVDARYLSWTAATTDGLTRSGMIVRETATSIHLREAEGKEHDIDRAEIEDFISSQKSVMPEGLEKDLSKQDLRDIVAYLSGFDTPPKVIPGNQPKVVRQTNNGMVPLTAATAEIRGGDITFEAPFANIGYWHHQGDSVRWRFHVAEPGSYDIYINAACSNDSAGNAYRISGLAEPVDATVAGTGGWDRYRQFKIGSTMLTAGAHVLSISPTAAIQRALFDLKEVRLVPSGKDPEFAMVDVLDSPLPRYPPDIAPFLLDDTKPMERRQKAIDQRPGMGPAIIGLLAADIGPVDDAEEYWRIPWIWRVAMAVAKRNDGGEIRDLLEVSIPRADAPLQDWQVVVIGGGLINGATQVGVWPNQRMYEIFEGLPEVKKLWPNILQQASVMADDPSIRPGTRYDALRMVAMLDAEFAVSRLEHYLQEGIERELQMGAVSGLGDIDTPRSAKLLADALRHLAGRNRHLAIEVLLRTDDRAAVLKRLLQSGKLSLTKKEIEAFENHPLESVRLRFGTL